MRGRPFVKGQEAWNKNRKPFVCAWCESIFEVPKHRWTTARFCSRSCSSRWRAVNTPRTGPMVGGWKGGISRTYSYRLKKDMPKVCSSCGERPCEHCGRGPKLVLHHIDENPRNNDPSNLTILCGRCHHLVHGKQFYLSSPALSGRKK